MTEKPLDDIDGLAAEHALGSLPPAERAAVARRLALDGPLADAVAAWEERLGPLSHREPGLAPPPQALEGILAGLARRAEATRAEHVASLRRSIGRWRVAAGVAALAAALALAVPVGLVAWPTSGGYAVLAAGPADAADEALSAGRPLFLVMAGPGPRTIRLRQVSGRAAPGGRSYVLWIGAGPAPRRVGALTSGEPASRFETQVPVAVGDVILLTAEVEPLAATPSGPVVATGRLMAAVP